MCVCVCGVCDVSVCMCVMYGVCTNDIYKCVWVWLLTASSEVSELEKSSGVSVKRGDWEGLSVSSATASVASATTTGSNKSLKHMTPRYLCIRAVSLACQDASYPYSMLIQWNLC